MVRRLLGEQRRRLVGSLLGAAEASSWWSRLDVGEQKAHRDKVLASIGTYHDFCLDVLKVSGEGMVRNEHAVTLIEQIHDSQRRMEAQARHA